MFDLISAEYGWTDEQILDLTVGRLLQVRDTITARQAEQYRRAVGLDELKVRTLSAAIHSAAGNKRGLKGVDKIRFLAKRARKKKSVPSDRAVAMAFGGGGAEDMDEVMRIAREQDAAEAAHHG